MEYYEEGAEFTYLTVQPLVSITALLADHPTDAVALLLIIRLPDIAICVAGNELNMLDDAVASDGRLRYVIPDLLLNTPNPHHSNPAKLAETKLPVIRKSVFAFIAFTLGAVILNTGI